MQCPICSQEASKSCSACNNIYYCSSEHQKEDWKRHRNECAPYSVTIKDGVKVLVIRRNVPQGDIILDETPVFYVSESNGLPAESICVVCGLNMNQSLARRCSLCMWPVCGSNCEAHPTHREYECKLFAGTKFIYEPSMLHELVRILTIVRAAAIKRISPSVWSDLNELLNGTSSYRHDWRVTNASEYKKFLREILPNSTEKQREEALEDALTLHKVSMRRAFYINVEDNLKNVDVTSNTVWRSGNYVYKIASLAKHSCVPNCVWSISNFPDFKIRIRAAQDLTKGQVLTVNHMEYHVEGHKGTVERRMGHFARFGHICRCERCVDPTECGTYASAVVCESCQDVNKKRDDENLGYLLPENTLTALGIKGNLPWRCNSCGRVVQLSKFYSTILAIKDILADQDSKLSHFDPQHAEPLTKCLIEKYSGTFLHPNHWLIQSANFLLININFRKFCLIDIGSAKLEDVNNVLDRCEYLRRSFDKFYTGLNLLKSRLNMIIAGLLTLQMNCEMTTLEDSAVIQEKTQVYVNRIVQHQKDILAFYQDDVAFKRNNSKSELGPFAQKDLDEWKPFLMEILMDEAKKKTATDEEDKKAATVEEEKKAASDEEVNKPAADEEENKPATDEEEDNPATDEEEKKAATDEEENKAGTDEEEKKSATDEERKKAAVTRRCPICSQEASKSCSACKNIYYCSSEHQKEDWKRHRNECAPYSVTIKDGVKVLVIRRNVPQGAIIFDEVPVFHVPEYNASLAESTCVVCGLSMNESLPRKCSLCMWPVCGSDCEAHPIHREYECKLFAGTKLKYQPSMMNELALILTAIRAAAIRKISPSVWSDLNELLNGTTSYVHNWKASMTSDCKRFLNTIWHDTKERKDAFEDAITLYKVVMRRAFFLNEDSSSTTIWRSGNYVYKIACLAKHSCVPNCVWNISNFPDFKIRIRAAQALTKGQVLTVDYLEHHLEGQKGTVERRMGYFPRFGYVCTCERCVDPTECGTYSSAVVCASCQDANKKHDDENLGYLLPENTLTAVGVKKSTWRCNSCDRVVQGTMFYSKIQMIADNVIDLDFRLRRSDPQRAEIVIEGLIEKYSGTFLHPNHWLIQRASLLLIDLAFAKLSLEPETVMKMEDLNKTLARCEYVQRILDKLYTGLNSIKSKVNITVASTVSRQMTCETDKLKGRIFVERSVFYIKKIIQTKKELVAFYEDDLSAEGNGIMSEYVKCMQKDLLDLTKIIENFWTVEEALIREENNSATYEEENSLAKDEEEIIPATDEKENKPATDAEANKPATDEEENKPATDAEANKPATDEEENKPATDAEVNKPATDEEENKPATDEGENKPATDDGENKPATDGEENKPATDEEENKPATDEEENKPATDDGENKPATDEEENKPATDEEESKPATDEEVNQQRRRK